MARRFTDLKSALVLSAALGLLAAATIPALLPSLPPEARALPLPVPVFCCLVAIQMFIVYGLLGFVGLRMARARGLEPAPYLTSIWEELGTCPNWSPAGRAFATGLGCGTCLVAIVAAIQWLFPQTLPPTLHPRGIVPALLASLSGSLGEEILFRLFAVSCLLRLFPAGRLGTMLAVGISALAFGVAHAPAMVFLFGGQQAVPLLSWLWLITLNGLLGVVLGAVFIRYGIGCAVLAHFGTDLVWHAASQILF